MIIYTSLNTTRIDTHESSDSEVISQISNEEYATIKLELNSWIPFDAGDHVYLFDNKYTLLDKPSPIDINGSNRYSYTLKFESSRAFLDQVNFELFDDTSLLVIDKYDPKTIYCKGNVVSSSTNIVWRFIGDTPSVGIALIEGAFWTQVASYSTGNYVSGNYVYISNVVYLCLKNTSLQPVEGEFWTVVNTAPAFDFTSILSPKDYAKLLCDNMNRARPNQHWIVGSCIGANPLSQAFSNVTCLGALTTISNLFQTEHWIDMDGNNFRININKLAIITNPIIRLEQGNGLSSITKQEVSGANKITRLVALGSEKNLYGTYRNGSNRLMLPNRYYIDSSNIDPNNPLEGVQTWDDVMPELHHATDDYNPNTDYHIGNQVLDLDGKSWDNILGCKGIYPVDGANWKLSEGTVTEFISQFKFIDSNLTFNPLDPKYIMSDGTIPKVSFLTGNMAGYQFPITGFDNMTITIGQIQDSTDSFLPSTAYGINKFDQYVFIDLYMPQTYINKAEQRLLAKATEYLSQYSIDQNQYDCPIDEIWATNNSVGFKIGQIIHLYNDKLGVDNDYRVIALKRNTTSPYKQSITLSQLPYIQSTYQSIKNTTTNNNTYLQQSGVTSPMFKSKTFRGAQEQIDMAFDPDGDFYTKTIQPLAIQTAALLVGTRTQQFSVSGIKFSSVSGTPDYISWTDGSLTDSLMQSSPRTWIIPFGNFTATGGDKATYYCYLKCPVNASLTSGDIIFTQTQYKTKDSEGIYYYFLVGTLGSASNGIREFSTSYGFSFISGSNITTGKSQSHDGSCYFDYDNNEIGGKINFVDGLISGNISIRNADGIERAWLNGASTPTDDIILGIGGAKTDADVPFKVMEDGSVYCAGGRLKALSDGSIDLEFRKTISDGDIIITINSSNGIISTRKEGHDNSISEMSVDGIIVNGGNMQAISSSSGIELKASVAALGYGNVEKNILNTSVLCGVYGSSSNSNSNPAPSYGGYFQKLKTNGLYLNVKSINASYTCTQYDDLISCYNTNTIVVTLPPNPYLGQVLLIRKNNTAIVNVEGGGNQVLQGEPFAWMLIGTRGDLVQVIFDGSYWLWNATNI